LFNFLFLLYHQDLTPNPSRRRGEYISASSSIPLPRKTSPSAPLRRRGEKKIVIFGLVLNPSSKGEGEERMGIAAMKNCL
jgi:hypothetical protein